MAYVNLGQVVYPIGAIYASGSSTSPASLFGGSWTQITNAALRGATSVGYTGSDSHTLSTNEMPSHRHISDSFATADYWLGYNSYGDTTTAAGVAYSNISNQYSIKVSSKITTSKFSEFRGGGAAHTNVQRSYNCYIWQRKS